MGIKPYSSLYPFWQMAGMVAVGVCRQCLFCSALRWADVFWVEMHKSDIIKGKIVN